MEVKSKAPPHGNAKYPWELWMNGEWHKAKRGRHFHVETESFRKSLGSRATAENRRRLAQGLPPITATTRVSGDTVTFQFSVKEG